MESMKKVVLQYLTAAALAVSCGYAEAAPALLKVPEAAVVDALDDDAGSGGTPERRAILRLLAADPRVSVRSRVPLWAGTMWFDEPAEAEALVRELASDPAVEVRDAAAAGVSVLLAVASPIDRMRIVADWSLAEGPSARIAIASALRLPIGVVGVASAIEHLAADPDAAVRTRALEAAERRYDEAPAAYRAVAIRLTHDEDPAVRRLAARLVRRA
jgi:hypothetical protein